MGAGWWLGGGARSDTSDTLLARFVGLGGSWVVAGWWLGGGAMPDTSDTLLARFGGPHMMVVWSR